MPTASRSPSTPSSPSSQKALETQFSKLLTGNYRPEEILERYREKFGTPPNLRKIPSLYAERRLGVRWWSKQAEVADALCDEDNLVQRVFVMASHSVGKTFMCGGIV